MFQSAALRIDSQLSTLNNGQSSLNTDNYFKAKLERK